MHQHAPQALSDFYWFVDAKHDKITPYEDLWMNIIILALQSKSFENRFVQLEGADYSYFDKYCNESQYPPEHLKDVARTCNPFQFVEIQDIYKKHLAFEQSHNNNGIQSADILTTSIRRAMNGNPQAGRLGKHRQTYDSVSAKVCEFRGYTTTCNWINNHPKIFRKKTTLLARNADVE